MEWVEVSVGGFGTGIKTKNPGFPPGSFLFELAGTNFLAVMLERYRPRICTDFGYRDTFTHTDLHLSAEALDVGAEVAFSGASHSVRG